MNQSGTKLFDEIPEGVFEHFAVLLSERLGRRVPTTEDAVRYTFFAALLTAGLTPENIALEYRHPTIAHAEVDTVVLDDSLDPAVAIEFKYDRAANSTSPRPQKAGALFSDLARLLNFSGVRRRYLVHLTDSEMAHYLDKPENGLREFFHLKEGAHLIVDDQFLQHRPPTFHKRMGAWPRKALLYSKCTKALPSDHYLRVFELRLATMVAPS